jgi:peptidoglycan/xylan/chitin deacetylase (PgdA/CDA1 family)
MSAHLKIPPLSVKAIVTFHSIDPSGSVMSYPPDLFAALLGALRESGLPVVGLQELLQPHIERAIAITFDDGIRSVYTHALPVLRDFGAPAHLFLTTGPIGSGKLWPDEDGNGLSFEMLSWEEIEKLHAAGVSIEGHTNSHPDMRTLSKTQMADECEHADRRIEERLGRQPNFFAYPFGYHNAATRDYARSRYTASVTTELGALCATHDTAAVPRLDSYYLQSRWLMLNFQSMPGRAYFRCRSMLRNLRGTQCPADAP